jgi:hypothetical protein
MSTVDGYTFIGGVNFGRDLIWRWRGEGDESRVNRYVQIGFVVTAVVSVLLAPSCAPPWICNDVGSVGVPALLIPLLASYSERWRLTPGAAVASMVSGALVSSSGSCPVTSPDLRISLGIEPIYLGLLASLIPALYSAYAASAGAKKTS